MQAPTLRTLLALAAILQLASAPLIAAAPGQVVLVQSVDYFSAASVPAAVTNLPSPVTAGDLIVVWVRWGTAPTTATVSDTLGNTWTPVSAGIESNNKGAGAQIFYTISATGGSDTITATYSQSVVRACLIACEYSGIDNNNPLEGEIHVLDNGIPAIPGSLTTTNAHDLLFAGVMSDSGDANPWAAETGYTLEQSDNRDAVEDQEVTAVGGYSAASIAGARGYSFIGQLAAFTAATQYSGAPVVLRAPAAPPPPIYEGSSFTLSVWAAGQAPLSYLWYKDGVSLGVTTTSLTLSNVTTSDTYAVVVTNSAGAVTNSVAVTITASPPLLTQDTSPAAATVFSSAAVRFTVGALGSSTLGYQWQFNDNPIAGATNSAYNAVNPQPGNYRCVITNSLGSTNSSEALVTVVATPTNSYPATVLADNPSYYWRLDEASGTVANDYWGGQDGTYNGAFTLGVPGYALSDPDTAVNFGASLGGGYYDPGYVGNISGSVVDFSAPNPEFSLEAWVNGSGQINPTYNPPFPALNFTNDAGILVKGLGASGTFGQPQQFVLDVNTNGFYEFFVCDVNGNQVGPVTASVGPDGTWQLLDAICDQAAGVITLYVNCVSQGTAPLTANRLWVSQSPVSIGASRSGGFTQYDWPFLGTVDEVAIYSHALTAGQVQNHFCAQYGPVGGPTITSDLSPIYTNLEDFTTTFSIVATNPSVPASALRYQWQRAEPASPTVFNNLTNGNASSYTTPPLDVTIDNGAKYRVITWVGSLVCGQVTTSAVATLTVVFPVGPPYMLSASGDRSFQNIFIYFDKAVDPSTITVPPASYTLTGTNDSLAVSTVTAIPDTFGNTIGVILGLASPMTAGASYTLSVSGVQDLAGESIDSTTVPGGKSRTASAWTLTYGYLTYDRWFGAQYPEGTGTTTYPGADVSTLFYNGIFPNSPDLSLLLTYSGHGDFFNPDGSSVVDFGAMISGFFIPPTDGNYQFYARGNASAAIWVSSDSTPPTPSAQPHKAGNYGFASPGPSWADTQTNFFIDTVQGILPDPTPIAMTGGQPYALECLHVKGTGAGFVEFTAGTDGVTTWGGGSVNNQCGGAYPDGSAPALGGAPTNSYNLTGNVIATYINPTLSTLTATGPINTTQYIGLTATFSVAANASLSIGTRLGENLTLVPASYQWYSNTTLIPGATAASYTTPALTQAASNSVYNVVVGVPGVASLGSITNSAILSVLPPQYPVIGTQPASPLTVLPGRTASFTVSATGANPLSYRWQYGASTNGPFANLSDNTAVSGSATSALSVNPVALSDAGYYRVVITNIFGAATSSVAQLVVTPIGYVQSADYFSGTASGTSGAAPLPSTANAGDLIVVWVRFGAVPCTASVSDTLGNTWTPVSDAIVSDSTHGANAGAGAQMFYTINQTTGSDTINVTYSASVPRRCVVASEYTGVAGSNPLEGEVHLLDSTSKSITVGPLSTTNAADLLFACSMSDNGDVGTWTVGAGYTLRQTDTRDIAEDQFVSAPGSYSATSTASSGASFVSQLAAFKAASDWQVPPVIRTQPTSPLVLTPGQTASFAVTAAGVSPLSYQWQYGASTNGPFANLSDNAAVSGSATAALTISPVALSGAGYYQVVITNTYGSVTSLVAQLVVNPISYVQSADYFSGTASGTSAAATLPSTATAGNLIVVWVRSGTATTPITVSDTLGNTWTPVSALLDSVGKGACAQMFYTINQASGSDTINVTYSASVPRRCIMASEYAGIASSNPLDGEVHLIDGTSTSITVGPLATSSAPDLLFACSMSDSGDVGSWTVGAGYTLRQFDTRDAAEDQFVSTPGSYSATFTASSGASFVTQLAAFKAGEASPGRPAFTGITRSGNSLTLSFTSASALLWTTNLALPMSNWFSVPVSGLSSVTSNIDLNQPRIFYGLKQ